MVAIDRDTVSDDPVDPSDTPEPAHGDYAAVEPGAADVAELGSIPPADVAKDLVSDGPAPPIGWRRRDFPPGGPVIRRIVWAPPWSLRPPNVEPEVWLYKTRRTRVL